MKTIKIAAGIAFALGFILILGAAGASDMAMEMQQAHNINWLQILGGLILMLPLPIIKSRCDR